MLSPLPVLPGCTACMQGSPVSLDDAEALREVLLAGSSNLHAPLFLDEQVLHHTQALRYEPEVGANLLQMLSCRAWAEQEPDHPLDKVREGMGCMVG